MPTLTDLPTTLVAGDSYDITLSLAAYPASAGWTLSLALTGLDELTKLSTASGDAHRLLLTPAETGALRAGLYKLRLRAERDAGATRDTFRTTTLTVTPDFGAVTGGELQSFAERALVALEAAIVGAASDEMKRMMIDGRQLEKMSLDEMLRARAKLRAELAAERRGSSFMRRPVTFVRG